MTAICAGGGPSDLKPQSPATVFLTGLGAQAIIEQIFGLASPWADLVVFAASQSISLSTFCATDPPALPTFSVSDIVDIVNGFPLSNKPGYLKLLQLIQYYAWFNYCQCITGAQPTPGAQPTIPPGAPAIGNPGNGGTPVPVDTPCLTQSDTNTWGFNSGGSFLISLSSTQQFIAGKTSFNWFAVNHIFSGGGVTITLRVRAFDAANVQLSSIVYPAVAPGGSFVVQFTVPNNTVLIQLDAPTITGPGISQLFDPATNALGYHIDWYCGNGPGGAPSMPCCPPDENTQALLFQIQNTVNAIFQSLPAPVNSFAAGTSHAGLTGAGSFGISGTAISVRVDLTAIPSHVGVSIGDPNFYFDAGFIAFETVEGAYSSQRLTFATQIFAVPLLGFQVDYTLENGVVATFTELTRGP